jgi:hypothetical protein
MSGLRGLRQPIGRGGGQKVSEKFSEICAAPSRFFSLSPQGRGEEEEGFAAIVHSPRSGENDDKRIARSAPNNAIGGAWKMSRFRRVQMCKFVNFFKIAKIAAGVYFPESSYFFAQKSVEKQETTRYGADSLRCGHHLDRHQLSHSLNVEASRRENSRMPE